MDCRVFRKKHLVFVDDTLPGVEVVQMQLHLAVCEACSSWDHQMRRSLLVVRNHMGQIEPSAQFRARFEARLAREKASLSAAPALFGTGRRVPVWSMALGIGVIGVAALALWQQPGASAIRTAQRAPAAIMERAAPTELPDYRTLNATPAFIATVSSGMAILPALMLVDEAQARRAGVAEGTPARAVGYTAQEPEQR